MSEVFWEMFWRFMLPSLLLMAGLLIGVIATLLVPISDEDRKKAAKEIDEGISGFVNEFTRPFDGLGMIGLRVVFFYIIGMFIILVLGTMLSDALDLPQIYDAALRIATFASEYLPAITFIITMIYVGQETGKVTGSFIKWIMKSVDYISNLKKTQDEAKLRTE